MCKNLKMQPVLPSELISVQGGDFVRAGLIVVRIVGFVLNAIYGDDKPKKDGPLPLITIGGDLELA